MLPPLLSGGSGRATVRPHPVETGLETWERPAIYSLEAWLVSCWREARYAFADVPSLLSPSQERALWHEIIEQEHPNLFDVAATVRLARAAATLVADWSIPTQGEAWTDHADAQQFQRWLRTFRKRCHENNWIARSDLPRLIAERFTKGQLKPSVTVFVGFENNAPSLEAVISSLAASAVRVHLEHPKQQKKAIAKGFDALTEEFDFAARRLRYLFEEKPDRVLALFVPDLAKNHQIAARTLNAVFFPSNGAKLDGLSGSASELLFHLSEGGSLTDQPLITAALLLLNLASPRIDHADAGAILRCPFVKGATEERNQRALADIDLRRHRELDVSFRDIEKAAARHCPIFFASLQRVAKILSKTLQRRPLAEWSELISDVLVAMGWPGDQTLSPLEERSIDQWKNQLSELSSLGLVSAPVSFEWALVQLRRLLGARLERGDLTSPIQVLDANLAHGVEFDAAIAVGLSEETWPPAIRISPLVPIKLQPPQSVRADRVQKTRELFECSPEILATFSGNMSPLAGSFVAKKGRDLPLWDGKLPIQSFSVVALEQQRDGQAPPLAAKGETRGGTGLIKAQSQCPFQAFAKYRLHARRPEDASFGFDALDRGSFVHKALELAWKRLRTSQNLRQIGSDDLKILVNECIQQAVGMDDSGPLHQLSVFTERERLETVILDWLEIERGRAQDFEVVHVEEEQKFEVPGLSLNVRLDRIDRLRDGSLVLIDYKSGKQSKPKLDGPRPAEPQLLVYAAAATAPVEGVFFGQLKPREVKAVGYSRVKQFGGRSVEAKKDWDDYLEKSRDSIYKLADEFVRGVSEVRPEGAPCEFCGMKPFCRVNEKGVAPEDEE